MQRWSMLRLRPAQAIDPGQISSAALPLRKPCRGPGSSFRGVTIDEFVEPAHGAVAGFVLVEERQLFLFKLLEKLLPRDLFEISVLRGKVEPKHAGPSLAASALHGGWRSATLLCPGADLIMVRRHLCFARGALRGLKFSALPMLEINVGPVLNVPGSGDGGFGRARELVAEVPIDHPA